MLVDDFAPTVEHERMGNFVDVECTLEIGILIEVHVELPSSPADEWCHFFTVARIVNGHSDDADTRLFVPFWVQLC